MPISRYKDFKRDQIFPNVKIRNRGTDQFFVYSIRDRLDTISSNVYGVPNYWWIILLANPEYNLEFDIPDGETIRVPFPLPDVLDEIQEKIDG